MTKEELKDLLDYDPDTGKFYWVVAKSRSIKVGDMAGTRHKQGYNQIRINGRLYLAHRLAWLYMTGNMPDSLIDHEDGDVSNNAWSNLRASSSLENNYNSKMQKSNTSGVKGVSWCNTHKRWVAKIGVGGKSILIGYFKDIGQAEVETRKAREKLHGEFANHG